MGRDGWRGFVFGIWVIGFLFVSVVVVLFLGLSAALVDFALFIDI